MDNANATRAQSHSDELPYPPPFNPAPDAGDLLATAAYLSGELVNWFFGLVRRLLEVKHG